MPQPVWVALVNPTAGGGRGARRGRAGVRALRSAGHRVLTVVGTGAEDARDRAGRALVALGQQPQGIVAIGGDGTVHIAANLAISFDVPLGVVPAGSGNDFARAAGVPSRTPLQAVDAIRAAARSGGRRVDLGRLGGGSVYGCVLSVGFDAAVNARANRLGGPLGRARYPMAMLMELPRLHPIACAVVVDDVAHHHDAVLVAIGNTPVYGGAMRICPDASITDGLLDVTVVANVSTPELIRLFPLVYRGGHLRHPAVHTYRGRRVRVERVGGPRPAVFADGEPMPEFGHDGAVEVSVLPGALHLLA